MSRILVVIIKLGVTILHIMESLQNRDATAAAASDVHHCTCPSNSTSLGCNDSCGCNAAAIRDGVAAISAQIHNGGGAAALNEACGSGTCGDVASSYTLPVHARKGQVVPYTTFVSTMPILSTMPGAGTGLAALGALEMFTWVGLYPGSVTPAFVPLTSPWRFFPVLSYLATAPPIPHPGSVTPKVNKKRAAHTMGGADGNLIIADEAVKAGVHLINEATPPRVANVWYVKLDNGYVLYFAAGYIAPNEELLTCYSRGYMKRCYPVPKSCTDPRCASAKHRTHSQALPEWRRPLAAAKPTAVSEQWMEATGLKE